MEAKDKKIKATYKKRCDWTAAVRSTCLRTELKSNSEFLPKTSHEISGEKKEATQTLTALIERVRDGGRLDIGSSRCYLSRRAKNELLDTRESRFAKSRRETLKECLVGTESEWRVRLPIFLEFGVPVHRTSWKRVRKLSIDVWNISFNRTRNKPETGAHNRKESNYNR